MISKTLDPTSLFSLQHELILSIGTFNNSEELFKKFSLRAIKTLNLKRIHILQIENESLEVSSNNFSIPPSSSSFFDKNIELTRYQDFVVPQDTAFIEEIKIANSYIYSFSVKDLGYMFLERRVKPFEDSLIQALVTPISRFSMSYSNRQQFLLNIKQKETIEKISNTLEQDKLKFEAILGAITDGVIAINTKKEIFYANNSAHKFLNRDDNSAPLNKKYYEYFRLFNLNDEKDITRELELLARQEIIWAPDKPVLLKANEASTIICEINVQEIRDRSENAIFNEIYYVITFHDITEAHKMEQVLAWQAMHDPLTEILNRTGFDREFNSEIANNQIDHHALICMDLDRFKQVNDIGGHLAGDSLLKQIADLMRQEIRDTDILARVGGDEFCILAKKCDIKYAHDLAERILVKVIRFRLQWKENIFGIGVSIGVSEIKPDDNDPTIVFFRADEASMRSKQNGRNQVTLAHEFSTNKPNEKKINYINYINKSLSNDETDFKFILYQQQIKAMAEEERDHIEILLRMSYQNKIIQPNAFLPTAERYGKISAIDFWVVKNALAYIKLGNGIDINVNLSGITLSDNKEMERLYSLISQHPIEAQSLCLEITETAAITNLSKCINFMDKATELGVTFALDDFGTGLSSFGNLKNLPVKYLKIDGSFIKDICDNKIDQIVVKSINEAAKAMNLKTVAEYVENQAVLDKISHIGIDYAQGYHLNKPELLQLH